MKKLLIMLLVAVSAAVVTLPVVADVVIIANPSVQENTISIRDLRDIFLGNRSRLSGGVVTPVLLREGAAHDAFLSQFIGRTPVQFQTHWRNIVFTGRGKALASFDRDEDVVEYVAGTSGAIGYVGTATPRSGVKEIKTE